MPELKEIILINDDYLTSLITDINHAKQSIDLEVYIFEDDLAGKSVAAALCNAAMKGVKIRVLIDGVGSSGWNGNISNQLKQAGIQTRIYHPLPWKFLHWLKFNQRPILIINKIFYYLSKINSRNHRKTCIIDRNIIYIGSANISENIFNSNTHKAWRETTVKWKNVDTKEIQYAFNKAWGYIPIKKRIRHFLEKKDANTTLHLNYSWRLRHQYYQQLINRISKCKNRIWVTNSYFVPDSHLLRKLINASRRGKDVRILLPKKSDIVFMPLVSSCFYSKLLKSGVTIYEYTPSILHAKILIIDDWYAIGSSNLNYRSFVHDLEVNAEIRTNDAKNTIESQFIHDINQSHQIKYADLTIQPHYKKLLGRIILLIQYWL